MRLHQRIAGNLAPHSDQRIPELLAGEFPARLSHFVRRADPVGAITAWQFPRDDRDQHRIVRAARGHEEQARIIVSDAEGYQPRLAGFSVTGETRGMRSAAIQPAR